MAPGGRRSISRTSAHSKTGSVPNSSMQSVDGSNSAASTSSRKVTGKAKNQALTDYIKAIGQKPWIETPLGLERPIGKWSKEFISEEAMKKFQSQPVQDGADPMPEDDICDEILGIRPGYIRGLGHGRVSLSSSSSSFNFEIAELTKRAEEAEKLNEELKERVLDQDQKIEEMKATQERKMEEMQANMEGMAAELEVFFSRMN